jgi:hypothetical protein
MSFKILHGFFGLRQQFIKPGRTLSAAAAVYPFRIGQSQSIVHSPVHSPEIFHAKIHVQRVFVGTIQAIMQKLPIF